MESVNSPLQASLVILENDRGEVAMQLRDDLPEIENPDCWCLFGGQLEAGETTVLAALREVKEELDSSLKSEKLIYLWPWVNPFGHVLHIFHYAVDDELDNAQILEGQDWGYFPKAEIATGVLRGKAIVQHHATILKKYWGENAPG